LNDCEKIWKEAVPEFALRDGGEPQNMLVRTAPSEYKNLERYTDANPLGRSVIISVCFISFFVLSLLAQYPDILPYSHEYVLLMIIGTASFSKKTIPILGFSEHHPRGMEQAGVH
jgi:hypothetical protein